MIQVVGDQPVDLGQVHLGCSESLIEAKEVGEQPDGYLGVVKGGPAIQALVRDINIKRKAAYTQSAQANGSTVEQFAFTTGCNLVARVPVGETLHLRPAPLPLSAPIATERPLPYISRVRPRHRPQAWGRLCRTAAFS